MSDLDVLQSKFRRFAELRQDRDVAKKALERVEQSYREYEAELMGEIEASGIKGSVKFDFDGDLGTIQFGTRKTVYGRIVDADAAMESFENEALSDEMTGTKFESRRLNEYVRDRLEQGQDLPPGVDYYERRYISVSVKND